ncbi:MAG TPA: diguanylate cyclase, partial [Clostridiales bacterium]|nr:diguanylate cyclase [Clostridiales bacterium]
AGAVDAAEKIRAVIENEKHPIAGCRTVSIGVAQRMQNEPVRHWQRRTDEALYQAKENGRNRVVASDDNKSSIGDSVWLSWQPEWESGNTGIDEQHQEMIKMTNYLISMASAGKGFKEIVRQVDQLLDHIVRHFEYEEGILTEKRYPYYKSHAGIHRDLVSKAMQLKESCRNGEALISALFAFIVEDVIMGHLLVYDTVFFPYTREERAGSQAASAVILS